MNILDEIIKATKLDDHADEKDQNYDHKTKKLMTSLISRLASDGEKEKNDLKIEALIEATDKKIKELGKKQKKEKIKSLITSLVNSIEETDNKETEKKQIVKDELKTNNSTLKAPDSDDASGSCQNASETDKIKEEVLDKKIKELDRLIAKELEKRTRVDISFS